MVYSKKIIAVFAVLVLVLLGRWNMGLADGFSLLVAGSLLLYEILKQILEHERELDEEEERREQEEEQAEAARRRASFLAMKRVSDRNHGIWW